MRIADLQVEPMGTAVDQAWESRDRQCLDESSGSVWIWTVLSRGKS